MKRDHAQRVLFEQLKRTVPIEAVLARYGIELRREGNSLKGRCPIHKGRNPRQFVVSNNLWRCFSPSCDRGGGMLELVAELERVDVKEAALLVADWFCIKPGSDVQQPKPQRSTRMSGARPSHKVYTVEQSESEDDKGWWTRIGSAWPTKSGRGLNVVLQALPIGNRLVLMEYTDEDAVEDDKRAAKRKK
jgi:hypothetical protein